jgi:hypothetical protein
VDKSELNSMMLDWRWMAVVFVGEVISPNLDAGGYFK